jgi:EipB-like
MARSPSSGVLAGLLVVTWSFPASAVLQPHVAAYRLSLASGPSIGIPFTEVRGGLLIEWRRACDGWLSRQRLAFVGTFEEGGGLSHDVRFSSWEALDGSKMRYSYRSYGDEELEEDFRGEARLEPSAGGVATFSEPSAREIKLPPRTIFPTAHIEQVLDEARAGSRFVTHQVFDGAGFDSLTQITSVISQPETLDPSAQDNQGAGRAWRVSMAYYDLHESSATPKFEAEFLLGENGVLRDVVLDYGDFQLDATLEKLELMTPPEC